MLVATYDTEAGVGRVVEGPWRMAGEGSALEKVRPSILSASSRRWPRGRRPTLDAVYKLQSYAWLPRRKRSEGKAT